MLPSIELFGKHITFYVICALAGILVVLAFILIYTKKKGYDEVFMLYVLLFSSIGVLIGSHLLYAITMHKYIALFFKNIDTIKTFSDFFDYMIAIFGGAVFYGGLIGGLLVAGIYLKKQKFDTDAYIGIGALCIPLFHTFGRLGCFLSGCCYGIEWKYGFYFNYSDAPDCAGVPRFPVQLLECILNLILFIILFYLFDKKNKSGKTIMITYLLSYPTIRFFLEFLRGDTYRGFIGPLSTSQFISILIIITVLMILLINKIKSIKNTPRTKEND